MEDKQNQWENHMAPNTHYWPCLKNGRSTDKWEYISALFMDLSRAFDTINQDLMPTKLKAYIFSTNALKLMHSYLK